MKPTEVLNLHREAIRQVVESHQTGNARAFGSVLHDDDNALPNPHVANLQQM
ncbi:MAG: hypothetical protein Q8L70_11250 [Methylotenera sp.]|nr:hypothetical protein [Methylotenera sp.]MDP1597416.1 hypothetical protein [Methylotenera sp.]MDP1960311.1 hypothetical protein [Methylotenera sp.]